MKKLRWGILGLGKIAHSFANDMALLDGHTLQAVASRSLPKAQSFQEKYEVITIYGSYKELMRDPHVDIIYIATPHNSHKKNAVEAMQHGKHVLCEKPMGINTEEVSEMIDTARTHEVFLMEAFWSRFNPAIQEIYQKIQEGLIGEIKYISSNFAFPAPFLPEKRLYNKALAGGALLDIGVYPLFLCYLLLGYPKKILASGIIGKTGIDETSTAILEYPSARASIYQSINHSSEMRAMIYGSKGYIQIHERWHEASSYTVYLDDLPSEEFQVNKVGKGYSHEMIHCKKCLVEGLVESPLWKWGDTLNILRMADDMRSQIGLNYPSEV